MDSTQPREKGWRRHCVHCDHAVGTNVVVLLALVAFDSAAAQGGGGTDYTQPGLKRTPLRGSICETFIDPDDQTVFGPFDAGFNAEQSAQFFGCTGNTVLSGGIDTRTELMRVRHLGSIGVCDPDPQIFDECGGHGGGGGGGGGGGMGDGMGDGNDNRGGRVRRHEPFLANRTVRQNGPEYHIHEDFSCLFDNNDASGHSSAIGTMLDGQLLFGFWEHFPTDTYPVLDACNGHFGVNPNSAGETVYHYHTTVLPPFSAGCLGPALDEDDNEVMVTLAMCRELYSTSNSVADTDGFDCDPTSTETLSLYDDTNGTSFTVEYDPDCPCWDGARPYNSNVGNVPLEFETAPTTTNPTVPPTAPPPTVPPPPPTTTAPTVTAAVQNVVIFMPDDMLFIWDEAPPQADGGNVFSNDHVPNINSIGADGVTFTKAYVAGPKCAPSRFNVLTGRYCSRSIFAREHGLTTAARTEVEVPPCKLKRGSSDETQNIQTMLQNAEGSPWEQIISGKWHLTAESEVSGNSAWDNYPGVVDIVGDTGFSDPAAVYFTNMEGALDAGTIEFCHNMEWMTEKANNAMERAVHAGKKFFLYFTPTAPHVPSTYTYAMGGTEGTLAFPDTTTPNGTVPTPVSGFTKTRADIKAIADTWNLRQRSRVSADVWCDEALGSLMAKMDELQVKNNTLIIVTMDHGQEAKSTLYESGTRVMLMARLPGVIAAGSRVMAPVVNLDLAPTIFEIAGLGNGYTTDGISWWTQATTAQGSGGVNPSTANDPLLQRNCIVGEMNQDRSVVCNALGYKLINRINSGTGDGKRDDYPFSDDTWQLYNVVDDPTEQCNIMTPNPTASCNVAITAELTAIYDLLKEYLECVDQDTHPTDPVPCDAEALFGPSASPTPGSGPFTYCQEGYNDYGVRYNWALGRITIATSHEACSARCSQYSGPEFNGGCKAYQTGMYFGFLYCRSYGGNLRTTPCAPWAVPTDPGMQSGALGSVHPQTGTLNVGGNCCSNSTFVDLDLARLAK